MKTCFLNNFYNVQLKTSLKKQSIIIDKAALQIIIKYYRLSHDVVICDDELCKYSKKNVYLPLGVLPPHNIF